MEIICLTVGDLATNCYLVTDEETRETLIIDPADEGDFISTTLLENKLVPKTIILTHGHYDHCLATLELKLNFDLPIYLHSKDLFLYEKAHFSAKHFSHLTIPKLPQIDHFIVDGEEIQFGNSSLKVLHTPGHTPGSVCLVTPLLARVGSSRPISGNPVLFTGDTIFVNGVGSTDHAYSSRPDLKKSLSKLRSEVPNLRSSLIYPGHEDFGVYPHLKG